MRIRLQRNIGPSFEDIRVLEVEGKLEWLPSPPDPGDHGMRWEGADVAKLRTRCEILLQNRVAELRRRIIGSEKRDCFYVHEMEELLRDAARSDRNCQEIVLLLRGLVNTRIDRVLISSEQDWRFAFERTATA